MEEIKKEPLCSALILVNIIVFIIVEATGSTENADHMLKCGALYVPSIISGQYYRFFSAMFLHFGMRHLINNMLVLFVLGGYLERTTGKLRFLITYLFGGLSGNIISFLFQTKRQEYAVCAGASGAVFAVMGGLLYVVLKNKGHLEDLSTRQIAIACGLSLYLGFAGSGVDNTAHVGGLIAGFLLLLLLYHPNSPGKINNKNKTNDF